MNYLWAGMLLVGIVYGCLTGKDGGDYPGGVGPRRGRPSLCV